MTTTSLFAEPPAHFERTTWMQVWFHAGGNALASEHCRR